MRKPRIALLAALTMILFCGVNTLAATTYYISYSSGSNSNNGLTKSTPWKSHPYMPTASGCSGSGSAPSYTHSAGDQFIFMGGDTWPAACWGTWNIAAGGSSGNNDYYGVDQTWYNSSVCGSAWCQPIFDAGNTYISSGGHGLITTNSGANYLTFDNWEVKNLYWNSSVTAKFSFFSLGNSCHTVLENMYVHHWTHDTVANGTGDYLYFTGTSDGGCGNITAADNTVYHNRIDNTDGSCDSGVALDGTLVDSNLVTCVPNGALALAVTFRNNIIYNIVNSFDDAGTSGCVVCVHENTIEIWLDNSTGTQYIYNNIVHDTTSRAYSGVVINPEFGQNSGCTTPTAYVFNNVFWNINWGQTMVVDSASSGGCPPTSTTDILWNNTAYDASGSGCVRVVNRNAGNIGTLKVQNLHCITSAGSFISFDSGISANSYTHTNIVLQTLSTANGQGYAISNSFQPTASSNSTVGTGVNLGSNATGNLIALGSDASGQWNTVGNNYGTGTDNSRGGSSCTPSAGVPGCWDVGAYMYVAGDPPPNAPTGLTASVQ